MPDPGWGCQIINELVWTLNPCSRKSAKSRFDKELVATFVYVLQFEQMGNTFTIRLPEDLAAWLEEAARKSGLSRGRIVRMELERARKVSKQPFLRLAGAVNGAPDLSSRKGFSKK
jgi:ribbon-helix-helix CopG family protein